MMAVVMWWYCSVIKFSSPFESMVSCVLRIYHSYNPFRPLRFVRSVLRHVTENLSTHKSRSIPFIIIIAMESYAQT